MEERKYLGHTMQEILLLIPGAGTCTPEDIRERLKGIHSYYTPEAISDFIMQGSPPVKKRVKSKAQNG